MALPTCPKCDNRVFELNAFTPLRSNYKLYAVNCTQCGAVVGVQEYFNSGALLTKLAEKLGVKM